MIPYFPQPEDHLVGPLTVHAFGAIVAVALIAGWRMAIARTRAKSLDPELVQDLLSYVVLSGFVVAHLYSVLAYFPREAMQDPLLLLKFWEDISSFGGFAGGLLGLRLFFPFQGAGCRRDNPVALPGRHRIRLPVRMGDRAHRLHGRPRPPRHRHDVPAGDPPGTPRGAGLHRRLLPGSRPAGRAAAARAPGKDGVP